MKRVLDYDRERDEGCLYTDWRVLLRGPAMQQSGENHGVWWFLVGCDTMYLLFSPHPLSHRPPSTSRCPTLPPLPLPSSRRSPARRRPCRGSRPRLSPARRSQRWVWTLTPCCAGWPAGRRPAWGSAAADAWWSWPARSCWRGQAPGTWSCPKRAAASLPYISQWSPAAATKQPVSPSSMTVIAIRDLWKYIMLSV